MFTASCIYPLNLPWLQLLPLAFPLKSWQRNTLNLYWDTLRQLINSHAAPCRFVGKELLVNRIHLREVIHGRYEHIDLDHLADIGACSFEDGGQILDAKLGHLGDGGGGLREDLAGGCARDLA